MFSKSEINVPLCWMVALAGASEIFSCRYINTLLNWLLGWSDLIVTEKECDKDDEIIPRDDFHFEKNFG